MKVTHTFDPVFDQDSRVLMLGTMPSPKSRENGFYYGHPRNRFWSVIADLCGRPKAETVEEKKKLLLDCHIALWDVLECCEIHGAADSSIKNPVPNDLRRITEHSSVKAVFATGTKAGELYKRYCYPMTNMEITILPSTSPANMKITYEELLKQYSIILKYMEFR